MRNALIVVGKSLAQNEAYIDYILREYRKKVLSISAIRFLSERNKDIFLEISEAHKRYDNLLVVATPQSYATLAKVIATLFEDNLVVKEDLLVPSKAERIAKNSFAIGEEKTINLVKTSPLQKLPQILLETDKESINLFVFDVSEEEMERVFEPLAQKMEVLYITTPVTHELYRVCVVNKPFGNIAGFIQEAKNHFPQRLIVAHNIFEYLIDRFSAAKKTITFAESCTGGLLASMLTKIPGSSNIFNGSLVTYANEIKHAWLGVKKETLQTFGAVSEETVEEMLEGAMRIAGADYAIAISGIAGPGGATPTKPVGTVVVGCRSKETELIRTKHFQGDRNYIQYQAAMYGIKLLLEVAKDDLL
jgi:nicotinamide-nucleotide amidase